MVQVVPNHETGQYMIPNRFTPQEQIEVKEYRYGQEPIDQMPIPEGTIPLMPMVALMPINEANHILIEAGYNNILYENERFGEVPRRLKIALGRLVGVSPEDIILANSASYGLHLLANGFPWRPGDELVLVRGDFPSVTLPWMALERRGVKVRIIEPGAGGLESEDLAKAFTERTKHFCTT